LEPFESNFYPTDPLEQAVQSAHVAAKHKRLTVDQIRTFVESIVSYDGLFEDFLRSPESIAKDVFQTDINNHVVVACYAVELRHILRRQTIVSNYKIAAFSMEIARKYLTDYGVLLVLDVNKLTAEKLLDVDGVKIFDPEFHFGSSIVRVLARDKVNSDNTAAIMKIVAEECPQVAFGVLTDVPGIAPLKTQAQVQQLKKFIVNIPTLGIVKEVIKSNGDIAALQEALDRKWKLTKNPHKNPEYTANYWITSPTINGDPNLIHNLVHEAAGDTYLVRTASDPTEAPKLNTPQPDANAQTPVAPKSRLKLPLQIEADEQEIFDLLLGINQKYNLGLTFRVAGGWVRDRALGVKSKDIDIALDKMTGAEFCKYITKETGKKPAIIAADEGKSKSLETATIGLGDTNIPIDFVNLRKEVYEPGSRVPKMTIGTAEEDAERRDLTLNSLFYNVNGGQVEDLTGKGLADLDSLTLRTPMDPKQTFADDPLRVFRVLRFFAKFKGATIADDTLKAIHDPEVQEALDPKNLIDVEVTDPKTGEVKIEKQRKISEERILTEWQKLHKGPQASAALRVAQESGLWNKVFVAGAKDMDMSGFHPFTMDQNNAWHIDNVFEHTMKVVDEYDKILRADDTDDDERARLLAAAFMHDLGKLDPSIIGQKEVEGIIRNTYHGHEDVSAKAAEAILRGIKSSNEEIEQIKTVVQNHMIPHNKMTNKQINKMIRNLGRSLVKRIVQHAKADSLSKPGGDTAHYDDILDRVQNAQAVEPNMVKPVVAGGILMQMFPGMKPQSGFIKEIQDRLQDMKDENPLMTEQEGLAAVEQMKPEIEQKYRNFVPQKKVLQPKPQKVAPVAPAVVAPIVPPTTASTVFNLSKQAEGSVELICGQIKLVDGALSLVGEKGTFGLKGATEKSSKEFARMLGERICGKGMVHHKNITVSEFTVVRRDPMEETVSIEREEPSDMTQFAVGDKIRHRKRGLAFQQITGEVEKIESNLMYVKWDGVEELEVFDLRDPVSIFGVLQKA
jgi:tRNA nucleotidyltransferase/poly(A) polymerase